MIVSSRAWLGWLLHYDLHYSLIVVSCLTCILWCVYALIWWCICYMIFIWLLNAWVILLVVEYSDVEYGWGRVSATVGVGLRSRAIVVIDLSRWVYWGLRTAVVLTSHLTLDHAAGYFSAVQRDEVVGLETESGPVWWLGAVSWNRPWLGVAYVRAVLSGSDLWGKCTSSAELEIHSNGRVLGIWHVTVWS
jgi:hypothetical protein